MWRGSGLLLNRVLCKLEWDPLTAAGPSVASDASAWSCGSDVAPMCDRSLGVVLWPRMLIRWPLCRSICSLASRTAVPTRHGKADRQFGRPFGFLIPLGSRRS